jgi:hypothetical protein
MLRQDCAHALEREKILAEGLREIAAELRLIDPADLVAFIRTERYGNIRTLVSSATEMYFKPEIITFGPAGHVELCLDGSPSISLDLQFRHQRVDVFFRLLLESEEAGVDIHYVSFGSGVVLDSQECNARLAQAIADARIPLLSAPKASKKADELAAGGLQPQA